MSGLMDKVKGAVGNDADKQAQPGDGVEKKADGAANNGKSQYSLHRRIDPRLMSY